MARREGRVLTAGESGNGTFRGALMNVADTTAFSGRVCGHCDVCGC